MSASQSNTFNPENRSRVKHTKIGVWDLYEDIPPQLEHIPGASQVEKVLEVRQNVLYLWRVMKEIVSIENCRLLVLATVLLQLLIGLVPAML